MDIGEISDFDELNELSVTSPKVGNINISC